MRVTAGNFKHSHSPQESAPAGNRASSLLLPTAICLATSVWLLVGYAFGASEPGVVIPSLISIWVLFALQSSLTSARFDSSNWLSPRNFALYLYYTHQVIVPITVALFGQRASIISLFYNAPESALAAAVYRNLLGTCSFVFCLVWFDSFWRRKDSSLHSSGRIIPFWFGLGMFVFGLITISVQFGTPWGMFVFYLDAENEKNLQPASTVVWVIANFFRYFASTGVIIMWCSLLDRRHLRKVALWSSPLFALVALLLCFNFNRASMLFPLWAMGAVFSQKVWRIPPFAVVFTIAVIFPAVLFYGALRGTSYRLSDAIFEKSVRDLVTQDLFIVSNLQTYFQAPQGQALLLDHQGAGDHGESLVASFMSPVPILGKAFRVRSTTEIYNRLIYGDLPASDQVVPYTGEWCMNFGLLGVAFGHALLALFVSFFDARFRNAGAGSMQAYCYALLGLWAAYGVIVSASVLSQLYIYLGIPLYFTLVCARGIGGNMGVDRGVRPALKRLRSDGSLPG